MARRPLLESRRTLPVLPGMKLRVDQTTYRSNSAGAVPVLAQWEWSVPTPEECRDRSGLSVPRWQRDDLLVVRHLLSSAQLRSKAESEPPVQLGPQYFDRALAAAASCSEGSPERCLEVKLLHPFVRGLSLDVREMVGRTEAPDEVKADAQANAVTPTEGLGRWLSGLFTARAADFELHQAHPECARYSVADEQSATQKNCTFAFASLGWSSGTLPLPGESLQGYRQLDLLRTGDALLAMRPHRFQIPLDPANQELPACSEATSLTCILNPPMVQGFTDIQLMIPVMTEKYTVYGSQQITYVPVGTSVAAFEREHGRVRQVLRARHWFPQRVALANGKWKLSEKLASKRGRIALYFPVKSGGAAKRGLIVPAGAGTDVLLAPGDVIVLDLR